MQMRENIYIHTFGLYIARQARCWYFTRIGRDEIRNFPFYFLTERAYNFYRHDFMEPYSLRYTHIVRVVLTDL